MIISYIILVTLAVGRFSMAAGSVDVRVTTIASEPSTMLSSSISIVTVLDDVAALNVRSLLVNT